MTAKTTPSKTITIRSSEAERLAFVAFTGYAANGHFKKIFKDSELLEEATIRNFRIVQTDIYAAHDIHNINKRAAYGKKIFSTLSRKLIEKYGKSFCEENLYRMTQFAKRRQ
jgi:hypothetical protein